MFEILKCPSPNQMTQFQTLQVNQSLVQTLQVNQSVYNEGNTWRVSGDH